MDGGLATSAATTGGDHQVISQLGWSSASQGHHTANGSHCQLPNPPPLYPYLDNISLPFADDSSANTPSSNDHIHQPPYLALSSLLNAPSSRSTFFFSHPLQATHRRMSFRQLGDRGGVFCSSHRVSPQVAAPLSLAVTASRNSIAYPHHHVQYPVPKMESPHQQSNVPTSASIASDTTRKDSDQRRSREPTHFRWDASTRHNGNRSSQQVIIDYH